MNAISSRPAASASSRTVPMLVVFDLDGTLVDTAPDLAGALNHCLRRAGLREMTVDEVRPHAGRGARAMLEEGYRHNGRAARDEDLARDMPLFLGRYAAHIADASRPFPGAVAALDRLANADCRLAVCTNKTEALASRLLAELGLRDRFAAVCGSDSFAGRKPDPVHLLGTIALAGGEASASVMIGDTDTDIEAARRAGLASILVEFGYDPCASARAKADRMVGTFDELDAPLLRGVLHARSAGSVGSAIDGARAFA